jgi:hypothetical protein
MESTIGNSRDLSSDVTRRLSLAALGDVLGARTLSVLRSAWDAWVDSAPYVAGVFGMGLFPIVRRSPR